MRLMQCYLLRRLGSTAVASQTCRHNSFLDKFWCEWETQSYSSPPSSSRTRCPARCRPTPLDEGSWARAEPEYRRSRGPDSARPSAHSRHPRTCGTSPASSPPCHTRHWCWFYGLRHARHHPGPCSVGKGQDSEQSRLQPHSPGPRYRPCCRSWTAQCEGWRGDWGWQVAAGSWRIQLCSGTPVGANRAAHLLHTRLHPHSPAQATSGSPHCSTGSGPHRTGCHCSRPDRYRRTHWHRHRSLWTGPWNRQHAHGTPHNWWPLNLKIHRNYKWVHQYMKYSSKPRGYHEKH